MFWVIKRVLPFGFIFLVNIKLPAFFILFKLVIWIMFGEENNFFEAPYYCGIA